MFKVINDQNGILRPRNLFIAIVVLFILFSRTVITLKLDWSWFEILGYESVFWTMLLSRFIIGAAVFFAAFLFSMINLYVIHRLAEKKIKTIFALLIAAGIGIIAGIAAGTSWMNVLQAIHAHPFGMNDPQFGLDLSFYIFKLPFWALIFKLCSIWLILNLIVTATYYIVYLPGRMEVASAGFKKRILTSFEKKGLMHIGALLGLNIVLQGFKYRLAAYEVLYKQSGSVIGAGAADVGARLPMYNIMAIVAFVLGILIIFLFKKNIKLAVVSIAAYFIAAVLLMGIVPGFYQKFIVDPEELGRETPYLERDIAYTRMAYGLDGLTEVEYPVGELTAADLQENADIIENIRIIDHRATKDTYGQQQEIRLYYDFADVDVDRYMIDGKLTQVFLSARELNQDSLPEQAKTFNNLMFKYTHGYGLVISPTNKVTDQGMPSYLVQDIPPRSELFKINEPRIYFGELTYNNVIVNSGLMEFDYPLGNDNAENIYEGTKGVRMGFLNKVFFAFRDMKLKYLLSSYITSESQYLETRNIRDRAYRIAPFLSYDTDPYLVLGEDGKLYYILDAYTSTNRFPYAKAYDETGRFNYLRNSVKITVDAYTGEILFYIADNNDPIVRSYQGIFPDLFRDISSMPADLKTHMRYPEALFNVQSRILCDYHMENTTVFYNREDRWEFSRENYAGKIQEQESYYAIIRLPGETEPEFIQMRAYTPTGKQNQVAWLAARSDGDKYGNLLLYKFPKGVQITGTLQVESIIDQDPDISSQLTLWSQGGSEVIRGNMLIYPLADSLLYVGPLYIEAESNKFPQLRKIFVYYKDRVIMADSLEKALYSLFGDSTSTGEGKEQLAPGGEEYMDYSGETNPYIEKLIILHEQSQEALRSGDLEEFGRIQKEMDQIFGELAGKDSPTIQ